jgi:hypothetical protein
VRLAQNTPFGARQTTVMRRTNRLRAERCPHLRDQRLRAAVNVGRGEAQESIPGVDEQVLAAIILDQALAMIASVVLDDKSCRRVIEVGSRHETRRRVRRFVWTSGLGNPAWISSQRSRVSIGDSAGAASCARVRNR